MPAVGAFPKSALTEIEPDTYLAVAAARSWERWQAAMVKAGYPGFRTAGRYAAYRWAALQNDMRAASLSPRGSAARAKYNLSSASTVPLAGHPLGSHEKGTRVDVIGAPIGVIIAIGRKYGWTREFGPNDPNHFMWDGHTAGGAVALPKSKKISHVVKSGDTLTALGKHYGVDWKTLAQINHVTGPKYTLRIGQKLVIKK